jgi:hypothetical protein
MDSSVISFKAIIFLINHTKKYPIIGPVILAKVLSGSYGGYRKKNPPFSLTLSTNSDRFLINVCSFGSADVSTIKFFKFLSPIQQIMFGDRFWLITIKVSFSESSESKAIGEM